MTDFLFRATTGHHSDIPCGFSRPHWRIGSPWPGSSTLMTSAPKSPSNVYPTSDGDLILIAANQNSVFRRLAAVMGRPELADDEHYATHGARGAHMAELDDLISEWTATVTAGDLLDALHAGGVPAGRIYRARDMLSDPHFAAREAIVRLAHPELGDLPMQGVFPRLSSTPGRVRHVGPELGEHNDEVYRGLLGLGDGEMEELTAGGVI